MFKEITKEIDYCGDKLILKIGKIARQANGSVLAQLGKTQVLSVVSINPEPKPDITFLPLSVHYREMAFAGGKIPGGFTKREGKPSDKEILTSRLIDRSIRPLFSDGYFNEIQVISTVLSYDPDHSPDIVALISAFAALATSGLDLGEVLGAARVGLIDDEFILNPSAEQRQNSKLDLVLAATDSSITMVESESAELSNEIILKGIKFGHKSIISVINLIKALQEAAAKDKIAMNYATVSHVEADIKEAFFDKIKEALKNSAKQDRDEASKKVYAEVTEALSEKHSANFIYLAYENVKAEIVRSLILKDKRLDGRHCEEIRRIECEVGLLHKTHGSALFTRGETQALAVTTLGSSQDEQWVEHLDSDTKEHFLLHYIFPPYSVNETSSPKAAGRREIGHGRLAWKAINPVLPTKDSFPYTIRSVSEITSSNGSTSMATVCGVSLSLMDAGVPLKNPVAGIAMGLVKEEAEFKILSDIMADEDFLGDMDFKVAGTKDGITALQMDIKIKGIDEGLMEQALNQARKGINHILSIMNKAISGHREDVSPYAPTIKILKDKIKEVLGAGGKVIKEICETTGAKIKVFEDGNVEVAGPTLAAAQKAIDWVLALGTEPEIGSVYEAEVIKLLEIGAIVKFNGNKESLLHINDLPTSVKEKFNQVFFIGNKVQVKFIGYDSKKRYKINLKHDENIEPAQNNEHVNKNNERNNNERKARPERKKNDEESNQVVSQRKYFN